MTIHKESKIRFPRRILSYILEIVAIFIVAVVLWLVGGMIAGYILDIHEWGGIWILAIIYVLPVVIGIALLIAIVVPIVAVVRDHYSSRSLAKRLVSPWFLLTFVITLSIFLGMGLKCGYLTFNCGIHRS